MAELEREVEAEDEHGLISVLLRLQRDGEVPLTKQHVKAILMVNKMQIRVKCNCGDEKCPEWAIIELQGVVESQSAVGDRIHDLEIGRLCCSSSSSEPSYIFTVGYHELSGKMIRLKKPLLVLKKKVATDVAVPDFPVSSAVQLEVVGIIRQKILFKTRPKALISGPQPKEKKPT